MIPNFEGLSRSSETLNEIFLNYTSALFRVEKLKEQNDEIKLRIDQEKVDGHVKKKVRHILIVSVLVCSSPRETLEFVFANPV